MIKDIFSDKGNFIPMKSAKKSFPLLGSKRFEGCCCAIKLYRGFEIPSLDKLFQLIIFPLSIFCAYFSDCFCTSILILLLANTPHTLQYSFSSYKSRQFSQ